MRSPGTLLENNNGRSADLKRIRAIATILLGCCVILAILARLATLHHGGCAPLHRGLGRGGRRRRARGLVRRRRIVVIAAAKLCRTPPSFRATKDVLMAAHSRKRLHHPRASSRMDRQTPCFGFLSYSPASLQTRHWKRFWRDRRQCTTSHSSETRQLRLSGFRGVHRLRNKLLDLGFDPRPK